MEGKRMNLSAKLKALQTDLKDWAYDHADEFIIAVIVVWSVFWFMLGAIIF